MNQIKNFEIEKAEIISVGTEILLGQILNTNARYLSSQLADMGINCFYQGTVGDNPRRLGESLDQAMKRSNLILLTGGLGPTEDDISMQVAAEHSGNQLKLNEKELVNLVQKLEEKGLTTQEDLELNRKQVLLPQEGYILPNDKGTAPGAIMFNLSSRENPNCLIVLLPGPPEEMQYMFENYAKDIISQYTNEEITSTYIKTFGISESRVFELIEKVMHSSNPSVATYAFPEDLTIRVSYKHKSEDEDLSPLLEIVNFIKTKLGDYIYTIGKESLAEVLFKQLKEEGATLSFAESCTAGMASATFANVSGASAVLRGSAVTYAIEAKHRVLNIDMKVLDTYGAVSAQTAELMAKNSRELYASDYSLSITGNAGPSPSEGKPVGLVYVGLASADGQVVKKLHLNGDRKTIRIKAMQSAYQLLLQKLNN